MSQEASMQSIKKFLIDVVLMGILLFCIYATVCLFTPFKRGVFCGDESLMFPYKTDTISTPVLRAYGFILPLLAILICEFVLLRKESDDHYVYKLRIPLWLRGFYCTTASFCFGTCFIELLINVSKIVIGRARPHFFDVCEPSIDCSQPEWRSRYIHPSEYQCLGHNKVALEDVHMSFLSGHSAISAFTMIYLALYLEKRMTWRGTRELRHCLQFAAIMISWFTAMSRVSDYKHHWSDVLAGYSLGLISAVIVWNWGTDILEIKKKHKPLPQQDSLPMQQNHMALPA